MSEHEPQQPNKAQEFVRNLSEDDLKQYLEAEVTEQLISEELARRLGARGLTFSYLVSDDGVEVWIKPETKS